MNFPGARQRRNSWNYSNLLIKMENPEKKYSFLKTYIKGETAIGFWNIVSRGLGGLSAILIISHLDVYKYGIYLLALSFYSLAEGFFLSPLNNVIFNDINRFIGEKKEAEAKKLFNEFFILRGLIAVILSAVVFLGADVAADFYGEDIADLLRILSPLFIIDFFYVSMRNLLQSRLHFGLTAFRPIVYKIVKIIFIFLLLTFSSISAKNVLIVHVASSFLVTMVFAPPFLKEYRIWKNIRSSSEKILIKIVKTYGKWPIFSNFIAQASVDVRPWLIRFFISTEAVAIFNVAESLFSAVKSAFPVATLPTLIPMEVSDKKRMGDFLVRGAKYLALWGIVLGLAGFLLVPPVVRMAFPQYESSIPLFKVLLLLFPILSFRTMASDFLVALRRQKFLFVVNNIKTLASFATPAIFLYFFGIFGMAMERVAIAIMAGGLMYGYLLKKEEHPAFWRSFFSFDARDKVFMIGLYKNFLTIARKSIFPRIKITVR